MQMLGVKDTDVIEEHMCINDHCCFKKVCKRQWIYHKDDVCYKCGSRWFKFLSSGAGVCLTWCHTLHSAIQGATHAAWEGGSGTQALCRRPSDTDSNSNVLIVESYLEDAV